MKKIKILVLLVAVSVATFYSCTDNNPIENEAVAQNSVAMRTAMNELKIANAISDRHSANATAANPFCFTFVYPLTISYNTGTTVTVSSLDGLLDILANETPNLYISGIAFPFQVMHNGAVSTIASEGQFIALLMSCGYTTINTDLLNSFCFDIVYPMTIVVNNQNVTITSQQGLIPYLNNPSNGMAQIVYPLSVNYNNQVVVIDNIYELYQMINNCDDCICTAVYEPVCVQTTTGIVEFGNLCYAQCAGYTQNDLVVCNPSTDCDVFNLTATPGPCNGNGTTTFPVTINFSYTNAPGTTFEVHDESGNLMGTYPLSSLPVTVNGFNNSGNPNTGSILSVNLVGSNNCSQSIQYLQTILCANCGCPSGGSPVCVQTPTGLIQYGNACLAQCAGHPSSSFVTCPAATFGSGLGTCFTISYPVLVQSGGMIVAVDTNPQMLQYYFPNQSPIPAFVYPVTATFGGQTVTIQNQSAFQSFIQANCN